MVRKRNFEIYETIKQSINEGFYSQGTKLPGENKLAIIYDVSRTTIRKALERLTEEGYIYKVKGSGNYINRKKIVQDRSSFSQLFFDLKRIGLKLTSRIISKEIVLAPAHVAHSMKIKPKEKLYAMTWIRMADEDPIIYETMYIPYKKVKGIEKENLNEICFYSLLSDKYEIEITHGEESFYPCFLNEVDSRFLKDDNRGLGMSVERIAYQGFEVIEYTNSIVKGERFIYKTLFKRRG